MKNFENYIPKKYMMSDFQKIEDGIYKTKSPYGSKDKHFCYVSYL